MNQLLFINGTLITAEVTHKADVAVKEGKISGIGIFNPSDYSDISNIC